MRSQSGRGDGSRKRKRGQRDEEEAAARSLPSSENPPSSEPEGEDLLDDALMRADYRKIEALDRYDADAIDDRDFGGLSAGERARAEAAMDERDNRHGVRPRALDDEEAGDEDIEAFETTAAAKRAKTGAADDEEVAYAPFDLQEYDMPLHEWVQQEATTQEIKRLFRWFLSTFRNRKNEHVYAAAIRQLVASNSRSLLVSYIHLTQAVPSLAIWLADVPKLLLPILNAVAKESVLAAFPHFLEDTAADEDIVVRITHLPIRDSLRELRQSHLNCLIQVHGVVTRRTSVFPQLKLARFTCQRCGNVTAPVMVRDDGEPRISQCSECQAAGPFTLNSEQTVYRNYQKITLQESPSQVPAGRVPRYKEVVLLGDLIDAARPGEEIEVTGVYTHAYDAGLNTRQGFPVFSTVMEANYIERREDANAADHLTQEDKDAIEELSRSPDVVKQLCSSIAPSIYGHEHVKLGLALSMFGGVEKDVNRKHRIRGDINMLMLGDPGVAKSQFLKYVETTAPRAVYTTGKGASAVGLTASVHKDPVTREWTLEGGALVLADRGVCLIDEFDKMGDADRTSIHEAMEQQSISISKAGIVTTLQARCAVIAAANPVGGRYDPAKTFAENVQLTDPILSRFDILCVLQDTVDAVKDERLARHVLRSHSRSHPEARKAGQGQGEGEGYEGAAAASGNDKTPGTPPKRRAGSEDEEEDEAAAGNGKGASPAAGSSVESQAPEVSQDLLRKYIGYARSTCRPRLTGINQDRVARLYAELRRESTVSDGIPIAVRHVESIMRMAESHARMGLKDQVDETDLNMAIRVMLESFIQAQRFSVMRSLRRYFSKYLDFYKDADQLLLFHLREIVGRQMRLDALLDGDGAGAESGTIRIKQRDLSAAAQESGITDIADFLEGDALRRAGFKYDQARREIVRTFA